MATNVPTGAAPHQEIRFHSVPVCHASFSPTLCTTLGLYECACQAAEVSDASDLNLVHACPEIGTQAVSTLPKPIPVVSDVVKDLGDLWEVKLWRDTPVAMQRFGQFVPLSPNAEYLASLRFHGMPRHEWPLGHRIVAFTSEAAEQGIAYEGLVLACMLESDAATFAPQVGRVPGDTFPDSPLLYFVHCLADLDDFLHRAHREAADKK